MKLKDAKKVHFIGVGGIGTSSLAQILFAQGKKISGSDMEKSAITDSLKRKGLKIDIGHRGMNISLSHDLVIYSPAIPSSNVELKTAKKNRIKTLTYPQALGELTKDYFTIAIAGTHGKSTTTAMTALILEKGQLDPTVIIGTKIKQFQNKNFRVGDSKYLILEACEYKKSFLNIDPDILVITNLEADHLDFYKNYNNYEKAFIELVKKVPTRGHIVINKNDKNLEKLEKYTKAKIEKWSLNKRSKTNFKLKVPGKFNLENAENAAKVGEILKIPETEIHKALESFAGTWRRMEQKKKRGYNCIFIDDYAHHPTEIKVTLNAIKEENKDKKILVIFQPHQYSRTKTLIKDFGKSFADAKKVIIPNIYKVRDSEEDIKKVTVEDLVNEIKKHKTSAIKIDGLKKTAEFIKQNHSKWDIIVTMGAGNIDNIYKLL